MSHSHPHTPKTARSWQVLSSLVVGAGIATVGSFLAWSPGSPLRQENQAAIAQTSPATSAIAPTANPNFITDVVTDVGPAVVRIDASRTVSQRIPDVFNDPTFRQFFGAVYPREIKNVPNVV